MPPDDPALIDAFRSGDEYAFVALYDRYKGAVYGYCAKMLLDRTAAEDLLQETFARAYEHRGRLLNSTSFKAWLFTIARNQCLNALRKRGREVGFADDAPEPPSPGATPFGHLLKAEQADLVQRTLETLSAVVPRGRGAARVPEPELRRDRGRDQDDRVVGQEPAVQGPPPDRPDAPAAPPPRARRPAARRRPDPRPMTSCTDDRAEALLNEYVDGELDHALQPELFGHLAGCAGCRDQFDALLAFRLAARQEPLAVPASADAALFARLDDLRRTSRRAPDRRAERGAWGGALRRRVSVGAALAVAGLAVAVGTLFAPAPEPADRAPDRIVETALPDGALYVIDPGVTVEAPRAR